MDEETAVTSSTGEIKKEIDKLDCNIEVISSLISKLTDKINPILASIPPKDNDNSEEKDPSLRSDIGNYLRIKNKSLEDIINNTNDIISRIEL